MTTSAAEVCERFGYPAEIEAILQALVDCVQSHASSKTSLVLSGSIATGDFVWRPTEDGVRLLSDIDATLFVDSAFTGQADLEDRIRALEMEASSPLFHVDITVLPFESHRSMAERFQHVEARIAGIVLFGEDVTHAYPDRVDAAFARQSTLSNLWKCVLTWPDSGDNSAENEAYRMALSRTVLDLPILASIAHGEYIAGHRARAQRFDEFEDDPPLIDERTRAAVRLALSMRERGDSSRAALEEAALVSISAALQSFGVPEVEVYSGSKQAVDAIASIVPNRTLRRFLGESRGLLRSNASLFSSIAWWLRRKEPSGAAALLALFAYVASGARGTPPDSIATRLVEYGGERRVSGGGVAFIAEARSAYWRARCRINPSDAAKADFYAALLDTGSVTPRSFESTA